MNFLPRYCLLFFISVIVLACNKGVQKNSELLFWCSNNNQEIKFCKAITDKWNASHTVNRIHQQPIPEGQSSEEVILAAVVGKTTPDIYANMWQGNVEMYANAKVLIPLDTIPGFLEFIRERCDSSVIKEITASDGHIYQVPWKVNPIMTIYNKNIFAENGITEVPRTYSAYRRAAAIITENNRKQNKTGSWFGYTEVKAIWYQRRFNFYPLYLAASGGGSLIEHNKAAFNNKHAVDVFRFLQSLYNDEYFSREILSSSADPFVTQKIATKWTGPWEIPYLNNIPDRNFEYAYYEPPVPDDHSGPVYTYADPKNIVIFNTCTNPRQALEFVKNIISKEGDLGLLEVTGQLPRRKNLESDPYYSNFFMNNPMLFPFARQLAYVKGDDNNEMIVEVLDIISQEYEACVVYGKKSPEKAIEAAERAVNVLLGENK